MSRKTSEENDRRYAEAKALVRSGISVVEACKQVGLNVGPYYDRARVAGKARNTEKKRPKIPAKTQRRAKAKTTVIDLPATMPVNRLMLFVGSPAEVLDIARSLG